MSQISSSPSFSFSNFQSIKPNIQEHKITGPTGPKDVINIPQIHVPWNKSPLDDFPL